MVFCGKPSRACYECRVRRIKCDRVKSGCSQCSRADKICSGYRDPCAIVIRDESRNVARKARARLEKGAVGKVQSRGESASDLKVIKQSERLDDPFSDVSSNAFPSYSTLPVAVEEQGFRFIFTNYIVVDSALPNGQPDYSSTKTWKQASLSEVMRDALTSVGLAALSNASNSPSMMVTARRKLSSVLRQTQAALQDPLEARSDTMLRTVMMLWLFEMVTWDPRSTKSSLDHLNGAASLVSLRASQNFESKGGLRKILRICFSKFIRYIQNDELDPSPIVDWVRLIDSFKGETECPACVLAYTLFKFISLCASIKKKELRVPAKIVERLLQIEADLTKWIEDLPPHWFFITKDADGSSACTFGGQLHAYHDMWISRIWSHYRWTRIVVHETIQQNISKMPVGWALNFASQQLESVAILRQMATDICVSVPFHLCHYNTQADKTLPRPEIIGAFDLLWPLTVVASSGYVSEDMYIWVVNLLEAIGHTMGIKQALMLVSTVKARRKCGHEKYIAGSRIVSDRML